MIAGTDTRLRMLTMWYERIEILATEHCIADWRLETLTHGG